MKMNVDAMISFTSTTIDDFAVMLYFMSLAELKEDDERSKEYIAILVAFFIGYTIVGVLALISLLFGLVLSEKYIALAGFVPLLAGIHKVYEEVKEKQLIEFCKERFEVLLGVRSADNLNTSMDSSIHGSHGIQLNEYSRVDLDDDTLESDINDDVDMILPGPARLKGSTKADLDQENHCEEIDMSKNGKEHAPSWAALPQSSEHGGKDDGNATHNPMGNSVHSEYDDESSDEFDGQLALPRYRDNSKFLGIFSWQLVRENVFGPVHWEVLMLTLASGSDHVVIYNAVLEDEEDEGAYYLILVSILVYYIMLVVHVFAAIALIRCNYIAQLFQKYSILLIIFLLIGTGVYILAGSVLFC